ncbi:hypothetical protein C2L98_15800 [Enterococcus gallinarum]|nr:hypothetical protein [Enterococcus gallinarum]PNY30382.1 hypothetical protein C2L98_15800 [Enterococcus gallinarum]TFV14458.1 hypothetical protein E4T76_15565 [Enterococcus gallinarum]
MGFSLSDVCQNHHRQTQIPEEIPMIEDENEVLGKTTIDFLQEKTLTLYYLLKIARKAKDKAFRANEDEKYQVLIKKIYVLENLIYEREGVFPKSMQDSILKKKRNEIIEFEKYLNEKGKFTMNG